MMRIGNGTFDLSSDYEELKVSTFLFDTQHLGQNKLCYMILSKQI